MVPFVLLALELPADRGVDAMPVGPGVETPLNEPFREAFNEAFNCSSPYTKAVFTWPSSNEKIHFHKSILANLQH